MLSVVCMKKVMSLMAIRLLEILLVDLLEHQQATTHNIPGRAGFHDSYE